MLPPLTVAVALRSATAQLSASDTARLDAELLLAHCLGIKRARLYSTPECELDEAVRSRFEALIAARGQHTPIAYLLGETEFWSLPLRVTPAVLVPRPETELLVEVALAAWPAAKPGTLIDLGTGSGAVAAALAHERPALSVFASDYSAAALALARSNFSRLDLARIVCLRADWLAAIAAQSCDVIVSNPPYVAHDEVVDTAVGFEPSMAIYADDAGGAALAAIINRAQQCLKPGGFIALEHGHAQGPRVRTMLASRGLVRIVSHRDLAGLERVTSAWRD
jgi:release factor glutamine methyltransferase